MKIKRITVGIIGTNCYLVEENGFSAVIDPGENPAFIDKAIKETLPSGPTHIILTHSHFDHVGALNAIHKLYPKALIAVSEKAELSTELIKNQAKNLIGSFYTSTCFGKVDFEIPQPDIFLKDKDILGPFEVLYTPGHTMDSICLYDQEEGILFSGDTLFCGSYGRTDLGGSLEDMKASLSKLFRLPQDTRVLPGHGEDTTIGDEQQLLFVI